MKKTILIYCGRGRYWSGEEIGILRRLGKKYDLLLLDRPDNSAYWQSSSINFIRRLKPDEYDIHFYVAAWGTENQSWFNYVDYSYSNFMGLYWNGAGENPSKPPPENDGLPWELWIPYTAGAIKGENRNSWGMDNLFKFLDSCHFPNYKICVQPNLKYGIRDRFDLLGIHNLACTHGMTLEFEYDASEEHLRDYQWLNWTDPEIFSCVYGGYKKILEVDDKL